MKRLLILSCSDRKRPDPGLLPAIHRYDGPAFRVLRKFIRERPNYAPHVMILSAKYGLIDSHHGIGQYNVRMSGSLADRLRSQVLGLLADKIQETCPQAVGICFGREYRRAIEGFEEIIGKAVKLEFLEGGLGRRLTALHRWLREERPVDSWTPPPGSC